MPQLRHQFSEASAPGEQRALPPAVDADAGPNGVRGYRLLPPVPPEFELVHDGAVSESSDERPAGNDGGGLWLRLLRPLDREAQETYQLTLAAYDGGEPVRNSTVALLIDVADENDERPTFERKVYTASVREDATPGTVVRVCCCRMLLAAVSLPCA